MKQEVSNAGDNVLLAAGGFIWSMLNMAMMETPTQIGVLARNPLAHTAVALFWWTLSWRCYYRLRFTNSWLALGYGLFALFGMGAGFGYFIGAMYKATILVLMRPDNFS